MDYRVFINNGNALGVQMCVSNIYILFVSSVDKKSDH